MRRTGSITARSLGRQIFDPGATAGVTRSILQPHFGFSGHAAAQNPPPDGLQGCLLGLLFPWAPPQQGKQADRVQAVGDWRARLTGDAEASAFLAN